MSANPKKSAGQIVGLGGAFMPPAAVRSPGARGTKPELYRITFPGLGQDAPHPTPWVRSDQLCGHFAAMIGSYAPDQKFGLESSVSGVQDAWGTLGEWRSFLNCHSMGLPGGGGGPMLPPPNPRKFW